MKDHRRGEVESALRGEWFLLRRPTVYGFDLSRGVGSPLSDYGQHFETETVQLLGMNSHAARFRRPSGGTFWRTFDALSRYTEVRLIDILDAPSAGRCILHPCCRETPEIGDACMAERVQIAVKAEKERREQSRRAREEARRAREEKP